MNDPLTKITANPEGVTLYIRSVKCLGGVCFLPSLLGTRAGFCSLVSISGGQREAPGDWGRGEMTGGGTRFDKSRWQVPESK